MKQINRIGGIFTFVWVAVSPAMAQAQWMTGTGGAIYYNGGNVGIGTQTPSAALVVQTGPTSDIFVGSSIVSGRGQLRLYGQPSFGVAVIGNEYYDGVASLKRVNAGGGGHMLIDNTTGTTAGDISFATWPSGAQDSSFSPATTLTIKNSGNVGIGTASPLYLLSVNGTIGAKDVIVTNTGWAD